MNAAAKALSAPLRPSRTLPSVTTRRAANWAAYVAVLEAYEDGHVSRTEALPAIRECVRVARCLESGCIP